MKTTIEINKVSSEMLGKYYQLRATYPNAMIMVIEAGIAVTLYDDAFMLYDIVHDGTPLIFASHPTSQDMRDLVPTFSIPEDDMDKHMMNIMSRNSALIVAHID